MGPETGKAVQGPVRKTALHPAFIKERQRRKISLA